MKTHIQRLLLVAVTLVAAIQSSYAQDVKENDICCNLDRANQTAGVAGPFVTDKFTGDISIPSSFTSGDVKYSVKSIGDQTYQVCSGLQRAAESLSTGGFCYNLDHENKTASVISPFLDDTYTGDISIPSSITYEDVTYSVTSIGDQAFYKCTELTSVTIPNSVTSIGEGAFYGCAGLTSVDIPNSVTSIGGYAFYGCSSFTSVDIPNSVTSIGEYALSYCTSLTSVNIPNSVTSIGDAVFFYCTDLTSVTIPNSVTSIGEGAFQYCSSLTSVDIPNSVTNIGEFAFLECRGLISVTIPNSVTSIGKGVFFGCTGLTSVDIPNSVMSIGELAFYGCSSLASVTIPSSVTSIETWAFSNCNNLTTIYSFNPIPPNVVFIFSCFDDDCYQNATLYVPNEAVEAYKAEFPWNKFRNIQGFDATGIATIEAEGSRLQDVYYDINGRRLNGPKNGLNIINGKKVILK